MIVSDCMNVVVTEKLKESWLQIRIRDDVKAEVKIVAELRGLSMSALVHSLLVRAVREERERLPSAFDSRKMKFDITTKRPKEMTDETKPDRKKKTG